MYCEEHGLTAELVVIRQHAGYFESIEAEELELQTRRRQPLNTYPIFGTDQNGHVGDHICVLEATQ